MKILLLSSYREACGVAKYSAELAAALVDAGHGVDVFPIDGAALDRRARDDLAAHFEGFFARIAGADAIVIQHEYALYAGVHGYEAACAVFDSLLARAAAAERPILAIFHTDPPGTPKVPPLSPVSRFRRDAWRRTMNTINRSPNVAALVHTNMARRRMIESGLDPAKLSVLPHPVPGISTGTRHPGPAQGNGGRLAIFGFVGRYKGYEAALRSLLLLPTGYTLTIAGGPHPRDPNNSTPAAIAAFLETGRFPGGDLPPLPEAEAAGVRAALAGRVTMTGYLADAQVPRLLNEADVVLLPYTKYGPAQSGAGAWALACRRPIVATDVETFAEINAERACMHLVAPDSPEALAAGIRRVAEDAALRESLVSAADRYAEDHSWGRAAQFLVRRLAAQRPSSPWSRIFGRLLRPSVGSGA